MGRRTIPVDKKLLEKSIKKCESSQKFSSQSKLWDAVAEDYNKNQEVEQINAGVVRLRALTWEIPIQTPQGRKGTTKQNNISPVSSADRTTRKEKFAASPAAIRSINAMRKDIPSAYRSVVEKIAEGSMKAAVKLKCLDCCNYDKVEIRECEAYSCPLWLFKPYNTNT